MSLTKVINLVCFGALLACSSIPAAAGDGPKDVSKSYSWRPVRIGAGGWVVGFVAHPSNASVRFARTDVGNVYRWDSATDQWVPMKIVNADGSGFPFSEFSAPGGGGVQSVAVDPENDKAVYVAAPGNRSADVGPSKGINIFRSVDGGRNFKAGNLNVPGDPNDNWRMFGERLCVDPRNSKVVYFGTGFGPSSNTGSGLYRSTDSGATWTTVSAPGVFQPTDNIVNVVISPAGTLTASGAAGAAVGRVSATIWARGGHNLANRFASDLYVSTDGGSSWRNISKTTAIEGKVGPLYLDRTGTLYVIQTESKRIWKLRDSTWTSIDVASGDSINGLAIDPKNENRIFAICNDASVCRSSDGGKTWTNFGRLQYANTLGWLPQVPGNAQAYGYRSTGGIAFDAAGSLWVCQGNEGMLTYKPSLANLESAESPPKWSIESKGIEELVSQDILVPKGSNDRIFTAVADATGMVTSNPDQFVAAQIPLQSNLISQGTQVSSCPGDPNTVVISTSNVYAAGANESGISFDTGKSWKRFASSLKYSDAWGTHDVQAGSIAISRRGNWTPGSDHIVQLPVNNMVPEYSKDGGKTWMATKSFPTDPSGLTFKKSSEYQGFWIFALKQRALYADAFVPDKFYLKLVNSPAGLYVSEDGGETWSGYSQNGLPSNTHHGQLAVNFAIPNDLWFVDGWEGASSHGLFHSEDGGKSFSKLPHFSNAITLALGAGPGVLSGAKYSVYVYGKYVNDPKWGIFRSTDAGRSWERVSYYPAGIFDQPTCMAASWDQFGKVYVGFSGQSYVYGIDLHGTH